MRLAGTLSFAAIGAAMTIAGLAEPADGATGVFRLPTSSGASRAVDGVSVRFDLPAAFTPARSPMTGARMRGTYDEVVTPRAGVECVVRLLASGGARRSRPMMGARVGAWSGGTFRISDRGLAGPFRWASGRDDATLVATSYRRAPRGLAPARLRFAAVEMRVDLVGAAAESTPLCRSARDQRAGTLRRAIVSARIIDRR